jgi:hypothetical protein
MGLQVFVSSWIIDGCLRNDAHMLAHTRPPGSLPFVDCGMDHCAIHRVEVDVGVPEAGPSLPGGGTTHESSRRWRMKGLPYQMVTAQTSIGANDTAYSGR